MKPVLYVVIPVFNEAENTRRLVSNLKRLREHVNHEFDTRVIVVDDGSSDNTAELLMTQAGDLDVQVLTHSGNQGPGAAVGRAFEHLAKEIHQDDWIATMEGDNTSQVETLFQMMTRRKEGYDVVLASPYAYGGGFAGTPWWRLVLSHLANQFTMSVLGLYGFRVLSSFFRLHSARPLLMLQEIFGPRIVEMRGFEWALEMLYKMAILKLRISEVETLVDWQKRAGTSKMRTVKTIIGHLRVLLRHRKWQSAISFHRSALACAFRTRPSV